MSEANSLPANSELADNFNEEAKSPGFWHRTHVFLNGVHEGVSHVVSDVAGAAAAIPGLAWDAADTVAEVFGEDLYDGSATRDFFSATQEWTKENVSGTVAYILVPTAFAADAINGFERAELLDEKDQKIFTYTKNTTRVVGDLAVATGAVVLTGGAVTSALSASTITTTTGAISATSGAVSAASGSTGLISGAYAMIPTSIKVAAALGTGIAADKGFVGGFVGHGILQVPEKALDILGWERGANIIDTLSDKYETNFDHEGNQQPTWNDVGRQIVDGRAELWTIPEEERTEDDLKSTPRVFVDKAAEIAGNLVDDAVDGIGESLGDILPKDEKLSQFFNFLGGGENNSLLATAGFGLGGLLLGGTALGSFMGSGIFTAILSVGIAIAAALFLPSMFKRLAQETDPNAPSEEEAPVETPETDASTEEAATETSALRSEYDNASAQLELPLDAEPQPEETPQTNTENTSGEMPQHSQLPTLTPAPGM